MQQKIVHFLSDDIKLEGEFYLPDTDEHKDILIIPCSGFLGLKNIHPVKFAKFFTDKGYVCFSFDYRGFAGSEGERGCVILEQQISDIVHAASFCSQAPLGQNKKIVLLGWGMGGGMVLEAAHLIPQLAGVVCVNGFFNGKRVQQAMRSAENWQNFCDWLAKQRAQYTVSGEREQVSPFFVYPLDPVTQKYVDDVLYQNPDFGTKVDFRMADSLLRFAPEKRMDEISVSLLIAHGDTNELHPTTEAKSLYNTFQGKKELYWIPQAGHTEWMYEDHPKYQDLAAKILTWLDSVAKF